ncbi:MAG: hypothetical protein HY862_01265 [Chloroflexi bacterium]|nr:hypothetical protein [Chloroflexota bacterium]
MSNRPQVPRKRMYHAHDRKIILAKGYNESSEHVLMKAFLWALYLPDYPTLTVEIRIGDRYKPDVVALNDEGKPLFWGEGGQVSMEKVRAVAKRYRSTHFAIAKWHTRLDSVEELVTEALKGIKRNAPFELINFPADSAERFLDEGGHLQINQSDVEIRRLG